MNDRFTEYAVLSASPSSTVACMATLFSLDTLVPIVMCCLIGIMIFGDGGE